jgi:hypothetical protein
MKTPITVFQEICSLVVDMVARQRIAIALSKGNASRANRTVDLRAPATWEFSGFSQNGEDGVLDVLRSQLLRRSRTFVEIGCADGIENNSAWMVLTEQYGGVLVEGDPMLAARARRNIMPYSVSVDVQQLFVTPTTVSPLVDSLDVKDPDVFSLDIDGVDYYVAQAVFDAGVRPKIVVVEYNSVYGPDRSHTIEYRPDFSFSKAHPTQLYYGVSIRGWRRFFDARGYRFVTVERNGVNAFFVDPACFDPAFLNGVWPIEFAENQYQYRKFRTSLEAQYALIDDQRFVEIQD